MTRTEKYQLQLAELRLDMQFFIALQVDKSFNRYVDKFVKWDRKFEFDFRKLLNL